MGGRQSHYRPVIRTGLMTLVTAAVITLSGYWGVTQAQQLFGVNSFDGSLGWKYTIESLEGTNLPREETILNEEQLHLALSGYFFTPSLASLQTSAVLSLLPGNVGAREFNTQLSFFNGFILGAGLGWNNALVEVKKEGAPAYQREQKGWSASGNLNLPWIPVRMRYSRLDTETRGTSDANNQEKSRYLTLEGNLSTALIPYTQLSLSAKGADRQDELNPASLNQRYYEVQSSAGSKFFYDLVQNNLSLQAYAWQQTGNGLPMAGRANLGEVLTVRHSAVTTSYATYDLALQVDQEYFSDRPAIDQRVGARVVTQFLPELSAEFNAGAGFNDSVIYTRRELTAGSTLSYGQNLGGYDFDASYGLAGTLGERTGTNSVVVRAPYVVPAEPPFEVWIPVKGIDLDSIQVWFKDDEAVPIIPWTEVTGYLEIIPKPDGTVTLVILDTEKIPPGKTIYVSYKVPESYQGEWNFLTHNLGAQVSRQVTPDLKVHALYRHNTVAASQSGENVAMPPVEDLSETRLGASYQVKEWLVNGEMRLLGETTQTEVNGSGKIGETQTYAWTTWTRDHQKKTWYAGLNGQQVVMDNVMLNAQGIAYQEMQNQDMIQQYLEGKADVSYQLLANLMLRGGLKVRTTNADISETSSNLFTWHISADWRIGSTIMALALEQEITRLTGETYYGAPVITDYKESKLTLGLSRSF